MLANAVCDGKEVILINCNPHPTPRAEIAKIEYYKDTSKIVEKRLREWNEIDRLARGYEALGFSLKFHHLGLRRKKVINVHQVALLRNLDILSCSRRDEGSLGVS